MAAGFNINAQLRVLAPTNLAAVRKNIQSQLQGIQAQVTFSVPKNLNKSIGGLNQSLPTLATNLNKVTAAATSAEKAMAALAGATRSLQAQNVSGTVNRNTKSIDEYSKSVNRARAETTNFGNQAGIALRRFSAFAVGASTLVGGIQAFRVGITEAVKFQNEMVRLSQVTNKSLNNLQDISDTIGDLSIKFGVSSQELSKVAVTLGQAGFTAKDVKIALDVLAKTDLAPTFDSIEKTTEGMIAVFRQFRLEASDLEGVFGAINAVSAAYAVESSDIIEAVKRAGGAFRTAGGNVNEFIALFTSVRDTTRQSAEVIATSFNTIFTRLQRPQTLKFLDQLNVKLTEIGPGGERLFVGPIEAIRRLNEAISKLDTRDVKFSRIAEVLGGYRQIPRLIPLLQEFRTTQEAYNVALAGTASLSKDAVTAQQSLLRQFTSLKERFLEFVRSLGKNHTVKAFAESLLELANAAITLTNAVKPLIPALGGLLLIKGISFGRSLIKGAASGKTFLASGGVVPGRGNTDSVPAMLTPGEFVIRKKAVEAIGTDKLHSLNKYAKGGPVGFARGGRARSQAVNNFFANNIDPFIGADAETLISAPNQKNPAAPHLPKFLSQTYKDVFEHRGLLYDIAQGEKQEILNYIPKGSQYLAHGVQALTFKNKKNLVTRIQSGKVDRLNHEAVLQPLTSKYFPKANVSVEVLPYAPSIYGLSKGFLESGQDEKSSKLEEQFRKIIVPTLTANLVRDGHYPADLHLQNIGLVGGKFGKTNDFRIIDPGNIISASQEMGTLEHAKSRAEFDERYFTRRVGAGDGRAIAARIAQANFGKAPFKLPKFKGFAGGGGVHFVPQTNVPIPIKLLSKFIGINQDRASYFRTNAHIQYDKPFQVIQNEERLQDEALKRLRSLKNIEPKKLSLLENLASSGYKKAAPQAILDILNNPVKTPLTIEESLLDFHGSSGLGQVDDVNFNNNVAKALYAHLTKSKEGFFGFQVPTGSSFKGRVFSYNASGKYSELNEKRRFASGGYVDSLRNLAKRSTPNQRALLKTLGGISLTDSQRSNFVDRFQQGVFDRDYIKNLIKNAKDRNLEATGRSIAGKRVNRTTARGLVNQFSDDLSYNLNNVPLGTNINDKVESLQFAGPGRLKQIGVGAYAVAYRNALTEKVLRISSELQDRPNIPEVLQADKSAILHGYKHEILDYVEPLDKRIDAIGKKFPDRDVNHDLLRNYFIRKLMARGYEGHDLNKPNIGFLGGDTSKPMILDPGYIEKTKSTYYDRHDKIRQEILDPNYMLDEIKKEYGYASGGRVSNILKGYFGATGIDPRKLYRRLKRDKYTPGMGAFTTIFDEITFKSHKKHGIEHFEETIFHELSHALDSKIGNILFPTGINQPFASDVPGSNPLMNFSNDFLKLVLPKISGKAREYLSQGVNAKGYSLYSMKRDLQAKEAFALGSTTALLGKSQQSGYIPKDIFNKDEIDYLSSLYHKNVLPFARKKLGYATGGNVDSVPALLTPGEFVIRKQAAQKIGLHNLHKLNHAEKFAKGGPVRMATGGEAIDIGTTRAVKIGDILKGVSGPDRVNAEFQIINNLLKSTTEHFKRLNPTLDDITATAKAQRFIQKKFVDSTGKLIESQEVLTTSMSKSLSAARKGVVGANGIVPIIGNKPVPPPPPGPGFVERNRGRFERFNQAALGSAFVLPLLTQNLDASKSPIAAGAQGAAFGLSAGATLSQLIPNPVVGAVATVSLGVVTAIDAISEQFKQVKVDKLAKSVDGFNSQIELISKKKVLTRADIGSLDAAAISQELNVRGLQRAQKETTPIRGFLGNITEGAKSYFANAVSKDVEGPLNNIIKFAQRFNVFGLALSGAEAAGFNPARALQLDNRALERSRKLAATEIEEKDKKDEASTTIQSAQAALFGRARLLGQNNVLLKTNEDFDKNGLSAGIQNVAQKLVDIGTFKNLADALKEVQNIVKGTTNAITSQNKLEQFLRNIEAAQDGIFEFGQTIENFASRVESIGIERSLSVGALQSRLGGGLNFDTTRTQRLEQFGAKNGEFATGLGQLNKIVPIPAELNDFILDVSNIQANTDKAIRIASEGGFLTQGQDFTKLTDRIIGKEGLNLKTTISKDIVRNTIAGILDQSGDSVQDADIEKLKKNPKELTQRILEGINTKDFADKFAEISKTLDTETQRYAEVFQKTIELQKEYNEILSQSDDLTFDRTRILAKFNRDENVPLDNRTNLRVARLTGGELDPAVIGARARGVNAQLLAAQQSGDVQAQLRLGQQLGQLTDALKEEIDVSKTVSNAMERLEKATEKTNAVRSLGRSFFGADTQGRFQILKDAQLVLAAKQQGSLDRFNVEQQGSIVNALSGPLGTIFPNLLDDLIGNSTGSGRIFGELTKLFKGAEAGPQQEVIAAYDRAIVATNQLAQINQQNTNVISDLNAKLSVDFTTALQTYTAELGVLVKQVSERALFKSLPDDIINLIKFKNDGGPVYAQRGRKLFRPKGTDTVPAMAGATPFMLTPGEFIVNRESTQKYGPLLEMINTNRLGLRKGLNKSNLYGDMLGSIATQDTTLRNQGLFGQNTTVKQKGYGGFFNNSKWLFSKGGVIYKAGGGLTKREFKKDPHVLGTDRYKDFDAIMNDDVARTRVGFSKEEIDGLFNRTNSSKIDYGILREEFSKNNRELLTNPATQSLMTKYDNFVKPQTPVVPSVYSSDTERQAEFQRGNNIRDQIRQKEEQNKLENDRRSNDTSLKKMEEDAEARRLYDQARRGKPLGDDVLGPRGGAAKDTDTGYRAFKNKSRTEQEIQLRREKEAGLVQPNSNKSLKYRDQIDKIKFDYNKRAAGDVERRRNGGIKNIQPTLGSSDFSPRLPTYEKPRKDFGTSPRDIRRAQNYARYKGVDVKTLLPPGTPIPGAPVANTPGAATPNKVTPPPNQTTPNQAAPSGPQASNPEQKTADLVSRFESILSKINGLQIELKVQDIKVDLSGADMLAKLEGGLKSVVGNAIIDQINKNLIPPGNKPLDRFA